MPAPTPTQLVGGNFTDSEGNVLANGYLIFKLNQDASVAGANICAGRDVTIYLDSTGNVASSASTPSAPNQYIWANANLSPINTYYRVSGYNATGQKVWGSNNQQVGAGVTFNLSTWVPNAVLSWFPQVQQPLLVEVAGFPFSSQSLLDFESTDGSIDITDRGEGNIDFQLSETTINNQSGSNYNAQLSDDGNLVVMSYSSGACTFTVLAATAFRVGAILTIIQAGTGQITLTPSGVTFQNPSSLTSRVQWSTISLTQIAAGVWVAAGDLT